MALEAQKSEYETLCKETDQRKGEFEEAKKDLQRRLETLTQEFMRQQGIMDEQMRRLQNEKFELKKELEGGGRSSGQQKAA
jgi:chromosome segregation ATPase